GLGSRCRLLFEPNVHPRASSPTQEANAARGYAEQGVLSLLFKVFSLWSTDIQRLLAYAKSLTFRVLLRLNLKRKLPAGETRSLTLVISCTS
ncbi:MAG: hypothetical protein AAGA10_19565, partial [Bacteroidota bacterium]